MSAKPFSPLGTGGTNRSLSGSNRIIGDRTRMLFPLHIPSDFKLNGIDVGSVCFTSLYSKLCFGKFWPRVGIAKHPTAQALGQNPNLFRKSEMGGALIHIVKVHMMIFSAFVSFIVIVAGEMCIFCVFVSCLCFYCLPKSSHADKFRLLSPAGCGSCGQLATAPTWSIASTPQCNEWNKTRCSDDDDDYDHLNILVYQSDPDPTQLINLNKTIWTQLRYLLLCSWKM